ncbi:uncharacterized protein LOC134223854 [Armigeres subalbatus]|uniref:uncharacterized protein LOC134223854 n=1 Tax=Armigeres subalbatus TaxID=124917 RepID=UPI002ED6721D
MDHFRCIIITTAIAVVLVLILTTEPCDGSTEESSTTPAVTVPNDDHKDDTNWQHVPMPPINLTGTDLPRPIVTPLDPSLVQPKRMKLKVSTKRRNHHQSNKNGTTVAATTTTSGKSSRPKHKRKPTMQSALQTAARKGLEAMVELFDKREPEMIRKGAVLDPDDPGALLSKFSSSDDLPENFTRSAYAALVAAKQLKDSTDVEYVALGRQVPPKISLKRTPLEGMCPSREPPPCVPASRRYRTHDGTCNNRRRPRWGSAQMPFHRFLAPEYADGVEAIRRTIANAPLPSARFVSLVVHGARQEEAPVTMMLALWGQLLDHDLTATAQPRSLNGSTPRCCGRNDEGLHPSCLPIKVPLDDPWLSPLGVRCLEFLRSAPAQRRDCLLSWREQTNQVTSYIDASPIYSSNPRTSDNARIFRNGMLLFGRGPPSEDVCFRAALANQCIRPGDARSGEQPGLLMLHMVWVNEHNQITTQLSDINPHWSDEKLYQETRRIVGAMFQHITYREFLPIVLGKEVCHLFDLDLETSGFYTGYDSNVNPTVANEFSSAAFRFGHSLIQGSYMRADRHHRFIPNNVTLHEESAEGDLGGPGSLHRLVRGMVNQRALKRDEFITAELTNHLFQTRSFPFGLDLAAINIQRGRDHGIQPYVNWRIPCGLTPIKDWSDLDRVMGPASALRLRKAYRSVDDIDLFVGGLAERPVVGGIVGPTFSCIIAQQFGNLRKGDRFWYENPGFESSFTPAQLESIRQVAFSQVLCRALGGGTLQPHVFLPADVVQNERLPCDSKLMSPIDLEPWTERDPFSRPNDEPNAEQSDNDLIAAQTFFSTSTTRKPMKNANIINKVDFIPNGSTGHQIPSNGQIVLNSPRPSTTVVNNKLDFNLNTARPTSPKPNPPKPAPQKDPFPTQSTVIDNKLDLTGTTAVPKRKPTRKTTPRLRPTPATNLIINNVDFSLKRDAIDNGTDDEDVEHSLTKRDLHLSKLFTKEDNATLLPKNNNNALRSGYYGAPAPAPPSDYDDVNNYDYNTDADPPVFVKPGYGYDSSYGPATDPPPNPYYGGYYTTEEPEPPPQPPYCVYNCYNPPVTTYNPYGLDTRRPTNRRTTPKRILSNKIISADFDNDQVRNRQTTRRPIQQQTQTVFQRPGLVVINNVRPNDKPIFLSPSPSTSVPSSSGLNSNVFLQKPINPSSSSASQSVFSVDPRPQFSSSRPIHQQSSVPSPIFSQKKTSHRKPQKQLLSMARKDLLPSRIVSSMLIRDYDYDVPDANRQDTLNIHEHDGYLRPEQNKYEPLKKTYGDGTYRNYSHYNAQEPHAYNYTIRPSTDVTLWPRTNLILVRYAERYQTPMEETDDELDQYVGPYIDHDKETHGDTEVTDKLDLTVTKTKTNDYHTTKLTSDSEYTNETTDLFKQNALTNNDHDVDQTGEKRTVQYIDLDKTTHNHDVHDIGPMMDHEDITNTKAKLIKTTFSTEDDTIVDITNESSTKEDDHSSLAKDNLELDNTEQDQLPDIYQTVSQKDKIYNTRTKDITLHRTDNVTDKVDFMYSETELTDASDLNVINLKDNNQTIDNKDKLYNYKELNKTEPLLNFYKSFETEDTTDNDGTDNTNIEQHTYKNEQKLQNEYQPKQEQTYDRLTSTFTDNKLATIDTTNAYTHTDFETIKTNQKRITTKHFEDLPDSDLDKTTTLKTDSTDHNEPNDLLDHLTNKPNFAKTTKGHTYYDEYDDDPNTTDPNSLDQLANLLDFQDVHPRTPDRTDPIESILPSDETETPTPVLTKPPDQTTQRTQRPHHRRRRPTSKRPTTTTTTIDGHGGHNDRRQPGIALVPFVLLTSIERPDNWVMFNVAKSKKRNPLPDVPQLKSDAFSLSELPKPISAED